MANSLFNSLNNHKPSLQDQLFQLKSNPMQFLMQRRLNIPRELQNNPQGIIQHLLNTGQMTQETYEKLQSQVHSMIGN